MVVSLREWLQTLTLLAVTAIGVVTVSWAIRINIQYGRSLERDRLALQIAHVEHSLRLARRLACYEFNEDWQRVTLPKVELP